MIKIEQLSRLWFGARVNLKAVLTFGFRMSGGGAHQSKTMMLKELEALMSTGLTEGHHLKSAVIDANVLEKSTQSTRNITFRYLASLYGLIKQPPISLVLLKIWRSDTYGHPLQALLVALVRDPLFRETAFLVLDGVIGESLQWPKFESAFISAFPTRFSEETCRALAVRCASSWAQSGHLSKTIKKVRKRVSPTPSTVALAALLASVSGFGGPTILSSGWMKVLDLSPEQALDHLHRAEAIGLARVRSAGEVTEISVRHPMATTLGVKELERF